MRLSRLLEYVQGDLFKGIGSGEYDPDIASIHYRSQEVIPGGLFVAVRGEVADGHDYIEDALSRGAAAVLAQKRIGDDKRIFLVADSRQALDHAAAAFYGHPSEGLTLIGVTGTNGKTTVTYLIESMLAAEGFRTGVIGTVNYRYADHVVDNPVTTPESLDLQRILAEMKAEGVSHVVMEVSSHGIDRARVASCRFDVGAFTNLTQDHLDYHKTLAEYWTCKQRFFTELLLQGPKGDRATVVLNTDNPYGRELYGKLSTRDRIPAMITFGKDKKNSVYPTDLVSDLSGIQATLVTPAGPVTCNSRLVGAYNLENILCAVSVGTALALSPESVRKGLDAAESVPGRLERVDDNLGRMVFVDYAHTPDALQNVLETLRGVSRNRLICVFGCGGDRDRGKRPEMGKIAGRLCDLAIITSDNPRTEAPDRIIDGIVAGVREEMTREISWESPEAWTGIKGYRVLADRAGAIREAVGAAKSGDVVLIAGKGHETYQIIGKEKRAFDDRLVAAEALGSTVTT